MDKLFILDASGYIYRSYFAIRHMTNQKGESTNALFGFIRSVMKLVKDFAPTHLVAVFDGPNNAKKRTALFPDYKANRKEMPKDLLHQILRAQYFCQLMGIPELMIPDVEADDTMGAVAKWAENHQSITYLCTSDKDMCQLVTERTWILNTFKENLILNPEGVENQFGVRPEQIIDYLAITGDASDNIPGLSGFGPKTAADLLGTFKTLDYLLDHPDEVSGKKKQDTLREEKDKVLLSRQLVTIDLSVIIPEQDEFYRLSPPSWEALKDFYASMSFFSLIKELEIPQASVLDVPAEIEKTSYTLVNDEDALKALVEHLSKQTEIALTIETTHPNPIKSEIVGIGLAVDPSTAWYIPLNNSLNSDNALNSLKPLFEHENIGFYGHNIKFDSHVLENYGIRLGTICFDTMLASYLLNSHLRQHSLEHLTLELFDKIKTPLSEVIGKGKGQLNMKEAPLEEVSNFACEEADYIVRTKQRLSRQLEERGLNQLYYNLELPLLQVLARMERQGIFVDTPFLQKVGQEIGCEIQTLEKAIFEMAGEPFNLNSPKQLSQILFSKLGIKAPKKTATGLSTNADVLESLKSAYPIAGKLLEYRTLEKLRSTYVETLPLEVYPVTQRIHCNYNQSVAATGRLACQDPNLQNIPVRTEVGRKIREAFRPQEPGWNFLAADYSQIELRLLAHFSEDPALLTAFTENEDIHTFTASLIFGLALQEVSKEQRHQAKAVNFGIIYGQQAFGLAQELGIDNKTAAVFIQLYFQRYPKVKEFLESCKEKARMTGRATTMMGRERLLPEIKSPNAMIRATAERFAVNTPIQGSQADLIKMAMLQIDKKIIEDRRKSSMILQIHDELIFEVPQEEIESTSDLVKKTMEGIMQLKVPLVVDIHIGKNWKEC
ncbi:MAG: DNA polymerase I [Parachlamydia sp.]|nr:DNA polymerase I [Parachlamydia sp.]